MSVLDECNRGERKGPRRGGCYDRQSLTPADKTTLVSDRRLRGRQPLQALEGTDRHPPFIPRRWPPKRPGKERLYLCPRRHRK